jgi:hypothetical protein
MTSWVRFGVQFRAHSRAMKRFVMTEADAAADKAVSTLSTGRASMRHNRALTRGLPAKCLARETHSVVALESWRATGALDDVLEPGPDIGSLTGEQTSEMSHRNDLTGREPALRSANIIPLRCVGGVAPWMATRGERTIQTLCIQLEAREIAAGRDLFGLWMVKMSY